MRFKAIIFSAFAFVNSYLFGQSNRERYLALTDIADSLYTIGDYHHAAVNYSLAANEFNVTGRPNDIYNATCCWALSGKIDSAFFYLDKVIRDGGYSDYNHIVQDRDLQILHNDERWPAYIELVKSNRRNQLNISKSMWRDDVLQLYSLLETWHVNLYSETPKICFDKEIATLVKKIDSLENDEIVMEIMRIVSLVKDGHTSFYPENQELADFYYFPLIFSEFKEGLFTVSGSDSFADIIGLKLVAIDDQKVEDIKRKLIPYIAMDNDAEISYTYPFLIQNANLLYFLGITKSKMHATLTFDKGRGKIKKEIWAFSREQYNNVEWLAARSSLNKIASSSHPTFLFSNPITVVKLMERPNYWSEVFDSKRVVYLQYLSCWNKEGSLSFREYINSNVFAFMDNHRRYRLVIDMRYNSGGDPNVANALIEGIKNRKSIFKGRKPIVLVGTRTFSAAATNVCQLKDICNAKIVGQIPRARPNSASEGRNFQLKNSKCTISISTQFVNRYPKSGRGYFIPLDKMIPLRYSDYVKDADKTFKWAINSNTCH